MDYGLYSSMLGLELKCVVLRKGERGENIVSFRTLCFCYCLQIKSEQVFARNSSPRFICENGSR